MYKENPLTVTTGSELWEMKTAVIVYRLVHNYKKSIYYNWLFVKKQLQTEYKPMQYEG